MIMAKPTRRMTCDLLIRKLNTTVKRDFKAWCAKRGISMTAAIQEFMKEAAKEQKIKAELPDPNTVVPMPDPN